MPAIFRFESLDAQKVELYFVQRNGRFNIGNISVKTFNESKFTTNVTRINTRIPTQFIKTPLTFKLLFYDYLNQQAEAEAIIVLELNLRRNRLTRVPPLLKNLN